MPVMGNIVPNFDFLLDSRKRDFPPKRTTSKFWILIYNALYENNIEIPFPQQDIHIRSIDSSINFGFNLPSSTTTSTTSSSSSSTSTTKEQE